MRTDAGVLCFQHWLLEKKMTSIRLRPDSIRPIMLQTCPLADGILQKLLQHAATHSRCFSVVRDQKRNGWLLCRCMCESKAFGFGSHCWLWFYAFACLAAGTGRKKGEYCKRMEKHLPMLVFFSPRTSQLIPNSYSFWCALPWRGWRTTRKEWVACHLTALGEPLTTVTLQIDLLIWGKTRTCWICCSVCLRRPVLRKSDIWRVVAEIRLKQMYCMTL